MQNTPTCQNCKWANQGKNCLKCFCPQQDNKALKDHIYLTFTCPYFSLGKPLEDKEMEELGYERLYHEVKRVDNENKEGWFYWKKK